MRLLKTAALMAILLSAGSHAATQASSLICKDEALKESKKLLSFYRDNDDRIEIDDNVTPLAKIKNPANARQHFDVLETWGYIYKGKYKMHLIYYTSPGTSDCVLMGEEILEYADL
ncbi:TPA: hypothetical protein ACIPUI_003986 [Citrobacter freundii]